MRPRSADTSEPAWVKRKILSMKNSTSWPSWSRKYSAIVRPDSATRARAPGGSFIWPTTSASMEPSEVALPSAASAWIGAVCSAFTWPRSSIGAPITLTIRPSVFGPTGTLICLPVLRTDWPRVRPSVESIAIVRSEFSPRCCATSSTRRLPVFSVSSAERIAGNSPSKATATTAPSTWASVPVPGTFGVAAGLFLVLAAVAIFVSSVELGCVAGGARFAGVGESPFAVTRFEGGGITGVAVEAELADEPCLAEAFRLAQHCVDRLRLGAGVLEHRGEAFLVRRRQRRRRIRRSRRGSGRRGRGGLLPARGKGDQGGTDQKLLHGISTPNLLIA